MAEIDDLKASILRLAQSNTDVATAVSGAATEMKGVADALAALKGQPTINPADVAEAAQTAGTIASNLEDAATSLNAAAAAAKNETGV